MISLASFGDTHGMHNISYKSRHVFSASIGSKYRILNGNA